MSGSTVSITPSHTYNTRRRTVEKKQSTEVADFPATGTAAGVSDDANLTAGDNSAEILRNARKPPAQTPARKSGATRKSSKPLWLTVISVLIKNAALLLVLLGFVQMIRWVVMNSNPSADGFSVISGDYDGKFADVENFVKKTVKAMQVQINAIDQKLDHEISSVRKEFDLKIEKKGEELELKLKALDVRSDVFEKFIDGFKSKNLLSKEEFSEFFEDFKKSRKNDGGAVSLDEIRDYAREVVEKEIERHSADGLGMVDYALALGGGRVTRHSEPFGKFVGIGSWLKNMNSVSGDSEKMLRPSFGEPGQCFALKGGSGFVEIRLRAPIVVEAVTLEHVAKSVAFDRSSAPQHCRVSGWLQGQDSSNVEMDTEKVFLLSEFRYDLEKSNAQTFQVLESSSSRVVDTVRLDFMSNHGSLSHTCIYRLRVHGHEIQA